MTQSDTTAVTSLSRRVSQVTAWTAGAQALTAASIPFVTRLYSPEDYGAYGASMAAVAVALALFALRYDAAIPLTETEADAAGLARLATGAVLLWAGAASVLVALAPSLRHEIGVTGWASAVALPVAMAGACLYQIATFEAVRARQYLPLGRSKVVSAGAAAALQLGLGAAHQGAWALIAGFAASRFAGVLSMPRRSRRGAPTALKRVSRQWGHYPRYVMPATLATVLGVQATPLVVAAFFGPAQTGQYTLAITVMVLPAAVIGQAAGQVFLGEATNEPDRRAAVTQDTAALLLIICFPFFATVALSGPLLFSLLFGDQFADAGRIAAIMAIPLGLSAFVSPLSVLVWIVGRERTGLKITVAETSCRLSALVLGAVTTSLFSTVMAYAVVGVGIVSVYFWWLLRLCGSSLSVWLRRHRRPFTTLVVATTVSVALSFAPTPEWSELAAGASVYGVASLVALRQLRREA